MYLVQSWSVVGQLWDAAEALGFDPEYAQVREGSPARNVGLFDDTPVSASKVSMQELKECDCQPIIVPDKHTRFVTYHLHLSFLPRHTSYCSAGSQPPRGRVFH